MGVIKDLVDLTTRLAESVQDRKAASELSKIQSLIAKLQAEQESLHRHNVKLREERIGHKEQIQELNAEIEKLKSGSPVGSTGAPICPNCSTDAKPIYMSPMPDFAASTMGATHRCTRCKYVA
jgi:DNA repair exonuclease SbcCD ATPase subunit